jgi:hypothetical protein
MITEGGSVRSGTIETVSDSVATTLTLPERSKARPCRISVDPAVAFAGIGTLNVITALPLGGDT